MYSNFPRDEWIIFLLQEELIQSGEFSHERALVLSLSNEELSETLLSIDNFFSFPLNSSR